MKQMRSDLISSRQTPRAYHHYECKYKKGMYTHILLEDFGRSFSLELAPFEEHDNFYGVTPTEDSLKKLLQFNDYSFFRYSFDTLLNTIMHYLIINGKTYLEIVKWTDSSGKLQGIELVPLCARRGIRFGETYFFSVKTPDGRSRFRLNKQAVVAFSLKDIGFKRRFFLRLISKLSRIDLSGYTDLTLDQNLKGIYSFTEHQKQMDYLLLKYTRKVFWYGRSHSNQHLSESYLLYREAYYAMLQYKFLDYILQRINNGFEPLRQEFGFEGKIVTCLPRIDYKKYLEEYCAGRINASQLGDIILKKTIPAVD